MNSEKNTSPLKKRSPSMTSALKKMIIGILSALSTILRPWRFLIVLFLILTSIHYVGNLLGFRGDTDHFNIAKRTGNVYECTQIDDINNREVCYHEVGRIFANKSACDLIKENITLRDGCLYWVIENVSDPDICQNISSMRIREACYYELIFRTGDTDLCKMLEGEDKILGCYIDYADELNDASICDRVDSPDNIEVCYALVENDPTYCKRTTDNYSQDLCYLILAVSQNTYEVCDLIENYTRKQTCYLEIAVQQDDDRCENIDPRLIPECITRIAVNREDRNLCSRLGDFDDRTECISSVNLQHMKTTMIKQVQQARENA